MDTPITPELVEKARAAGRPEEILALAKEHGMELTPEDAQVCYDRFHKTGELADDELDAVAGGGCARSVGGNQYTVVTSSTTCFTGHFKENTNAYRDRIWFMFGKDNGCGRCVFLKFDGAVGYCGLSEK